MCSMSRGGPVHCRAPRSAAGSDRAGGSVDISPATHAPARSLRAPSFPQVDRFVHLAVTSSAALLLPGRMHRRRPNCSTCSGRDKKILQHNGIRDRVLLSLSIEKTKGNDCSCSALRQIPTGDWMLGFVSFRPRFEVVVLLRDLQAAEGPHDTWPAATQNLTTETLRTQHS